MEGSVTTSAMSSKLFSLSTNPIFRQNLPSSSPSSSSALFLKISDLSSSSSSSSSSSRKQLQHHSKNHLNSHRNHRQSRRHNPLGATSPSGSQGLSSSSENESQELIQAQEALSELLSREFGLSPADSVAVSTGARRYLQMLIHGVGDLDELGLWNSMKRIGEEGSNGTEFGFKEKVSHMAMEKGDNGKVALLESLVGLSLASAMNVARYLSGESLSGLIAKVKYMKEIFFSGSNDEGTTGKNARRIMMHLSIPVDEDLQQTLSYFEKIEAKRGGLNMLGSVDVSFRYLVESFPRLLLLPLESKMNTMVEFLGSIGISRGCMRNVLLLFPPIMFYDIEVIKTRTLVFKELGLEENGIGKILTKYPWILSASIQQNYKEVMLFFTTEKLPNASVVSAIKSLPHLLGCSSGKMRLIVEEIEKLGVRNKKLGSITSKSPQILLRKPQEFVEMVSLFEDLGFDRESIAQIICRCPEIFATSIERTLKKKLQFLISIGVYESHFPRVIKKYPELLVSDVNRTLLPRARYLMNSGLSKKDVAFMVRRFSPLLGYSIEEVLRPKLDFLVNTMGKPLSDVVEYPRFLSYSLEKKIKPRFRILKQNNIECSLKDMLGRNDEEFASSFLEGFLDHESSQFVIGNEA